MLTVGTFQTVAEELFRFILRPIPWIHVLRWHLSTLVMIMPWHSIGHKAWSLPVLRIWPSLNQCTLMKTIGKPFLCYLNSFLLNQSWLVTWTRWVYLLAAGRCGNKFSSVMLQIEFIWNCYQVHIAEPHWWLVNIVSCNNGLVPSGNKLFHEPVLT